LSEHTAEGAENDRVAVSADIRGVTVAVSAGPGPLRRAQAAGKFFAADGEKLYLRGVTYGTFAAGEDGEELLDPDVVATDFGAMAEHGIDTVRTYTVPPRWSLDLAEANGLRVLVGLPWEQHVTFLDDRRLVGSIEERVRAGVARCAGHPAVLGFAVGNEIPSPIVRWHGRERIERFAERLYRAAKEEDGDALVTYVNYPSTEYLQLPFLDFVAFNVYLERRERLAAYVRRLQTIAGDRPLVLAELGLDSRRHGLDRQAETLDWQVRTAFDGGCPGAFVFAWTDEWSRRGFEIEDWDFGLTDRGRRSKPALATVARAYGCVPEPVHQEPRVSVVVCTHNGAATLRRCLDAATQLDYPDYEVIVVDDGSTDSTAEVAHSFGVRVVSTPNQGLSAARNHGLERATGEIVAYLDDDAWPDRDWLTYLAKAFRTTEHVALGGPNIPPPPRNLAERAVAAAPGGPVHVLLTDEIAEHAPGCNMAFRREELLELGGFDPQFRAAGDDVDVCWRIQEAGLTIGFVPAAMVWHHRRNSIRGYLRQQRGYGKAEALLERKWPERYNALGHAIWHGRVYGGSPPSRLSRRRRVYHGVWGTAPFQRLYQSRSPSASLPPMPEWLFGLAFLSALGLLWRPLLLALPLLVLALAFSLVHAYRSTELRGSPRARLVAMLLTLGQPLVRYWGRADHGLTPWRRRGHTGLALPWPRTLSVWSETWLAPADRLSILELGGRANGAALDAGGDYDRWDMQARGGIFGSARLRMAAEEHGGGRQFVRFRVWPRASRAALWLAAILAALAAGAVVWDDALPAAMLGSLAALVVVRTAFEGAAASAVLVHGVRRQEALAEHELTATLGRQARRARLRQSST
jgi:GT2 family glycosyltransferase